MQKDTFRSGPLTGITVLDLTSLLPGPYSTMMLADLGADVIKIEKPGVGDLTRHYSPKIKREGAYFLSVNRNKRSLALNLTCEKGKAIFMELVKSADVVLDGFRPGVMDKIGLGYDELKSVNPSIIACSISGYGQDGPYANKAGHDINYLSIAGVLGATGTKDGMPVIPGIQIADVGGGAMLAAVCILSALIARQKTGEGQYIDVAMTDGALAWQALTAGRYFADGTIPRPSREMLSGRFACYNVYATKDGRHIALGALEPQFWSAFCNAIGREDLIQRQFADGKEADALVDEVREIFYQRKRSEWMALLEDVDCCCEPVNDLDEAFSHPQVMHRKMVVEVDHPTEGKVRQLNFPGKFSKTAPSVRTAAPRLGEHNQEILETLGFTPEEISRLAQEKIISPADTI
jgi:crotonobetainyl-CoA:carnitine CoA-transferase CaiB-like acyl-CoA transferase